MSENLPSEGWEDLSVDEHDSLLVSSLHNAGESVVGFKRTSNRTSIKSKSLPVHISSMKVRVLTQ